MAVCTRVRVENGGVEEKKGGEKMSGRREEGTGEFETNVPAADGRNAVAFYLQWVW